MINQKKSELGMEARFPGFRNKELVEEDGLRAYVFYYNHEEQKNPCYTYGHYIGDDISRSLNTQLLLVPLDPTRVDELGYVIVRIDGRSVVSERYDQDSLTVSCELATGQKMTIEDHYYYEKYGGQSRDSKDPVTPLLDYLRGRLGYTELTEERLASWLRKMRARFTY